MPDSPAPTVPAQPRQLKMPTYECDGCGACCSGLLLVEAHYYDVLREPRIAEMHPNKKRAKGLNVLNECWVLGAGKGCGFLGLDNRCGIYATRPHACVSFAAGSERCQDVRRMRGLPPLEPVKSNGTLRHKINAELVNAGDDDDEW